MNDDENDDKKVIDLAGARKQQLALQKEKAKRAGASSGKATGSGKLRVWHWLQLVGFLVVMSYLMTLCSG